MRSRSFLTVSLALVALISATSAHADVCVAIDEARDTLSPADRSAALLLVARQFELGGEHAVPGGCSAQYLLSHIRLGETIVVTLTGPKGRRDATAVGLDDVPTVYNQMVRSLLTGQPMTLTGVVDRSNVSVTQAAKLRVDSDNVFYARLGYAGTFADRTYGMPSIGLLGYRHELDSFGVDVSFLNFSIKDNSAAVGDGNGGSWQWLRLEGLYFKNPTASQTMYFGGGLAYGATSLSSGSYAVGGTYRSWHGSGLEGELTAGYEIARASTIRMFLQADLGLPFYTLQSTQYNYASYYTPSTVITSSHYAPSLTISVALGWQRGAHTRR